MRSREILGEIEPYAYLQTWALIPWPTSGSKGTHRAEHPTPAAVRAYATAHMHELQEVAARVRREQKD